MVAVKQFAATENVQLAAAQPSLKTAVADYAEQ